MLKGRWVGVTVAGLLASQLGIAAAQESPSILVSPNPVGPGQMTTVYGRDFCADSACSAVTVLLDSETLAGDIQVSADGTFAFSFVASQLPDQYIVIARQTAGDGTQVEASYGFMILPPDLPPGQTTAPPQTLSPPTLAGQTPAPSQTPAETLSPAVTGETSPTPTATSRDDDNGSSLFPWALAVGAGIILVVFLFLAVRRVARDRPR